MAQPKVIADFETQLSTAISVGAVAFSLSSANDDDGNALPSGLYYFTIDNGQSNKEYLAGTLSGTSVTGVLNVSRQGVETSGAQRAHRVGASVILTDFATYMQYINNSTVFGAVDASTIAKGLVQIATPEQVLDKDDTGSTGAVLAVSPDNLASTLLSDYKEDTGAADAYAIAPIPAITAYVVGQRFSFKATNTNTTSSTLAVSGLATKAIKKQDGATDLVAGDIVDGQIVEVEYDGTNFQMISPSGNSLSDLVDTPVTRVYTSTTTWSKPAGLKYVIVELVGGGGSGGGSGTNSRGGGGGGGGGYSRKKILAASLGATEAVTIGDGGVAATAGNNNGNAGGTTSFGSHLSATGGEGGMAATSAGSASGGIGSNGDLNIRGQGGGQEVNSTNSGGGPGGSSMLGGGAPSQSATDTAGVAGGVYGGGGGGGYRGTGAVAGGVGAKGVVILTEYFI